MLNFLFENIGFCGIYQGKNQKGTRDMSQTVSLIYCKTILQIVPNGLQSRS